MQFDVGQAASHLVDAAEAALFLLPLAAERGELFAKLGHLRLDSGQALPGVLSVSSANWRAANSNCTSRRWTSSISAGTLSNSIASRLVASSIKSIALSGKKRSVM